MTIRTTCAEDTVLLGRKIGARLKAGDVLALTGPLAAGKTTLTKGLAQALGVSETITSPTFCLVSEYEGGRLPLYHFDVYRLEGAEDFANIGAEELLYGSGVCVVEWSEKVRTELPSSTIFLTISIESDGSRTVTISPWPYGELE